MGNRIYIETDASELQQEKRKNDIIRQLSLELSQTSGLKAKLENILAVLDQRFGLKNTMLLLPDQAHQRMAVFASRGFDENGIGAEVKFGEGVIGVVALRKKKLRMANISRMRLYVRTFTEKTAEKETLQSLPGLPNVESQVALPLLANDELIAVLSAESTDVNFFSPEDEDFLMTLSQLMALSIQNSLVMEQLEQKVRERTAALETKAHELEKVNASKDRLFAIIGHDLRSPAASLQQVAELIQYYSKKGAIQQMSETGGKIVKAAKNLSSMLDNLLNWSITQTGNLQLQPEKISLTELASEVTEIYEETAVLKQITLAIDATEEVFVLVDKNSTLTILRNLLCNALKFTQPGGRVQLRIRRNDTTAEMMIEDNGVGITAENLPTLYDLKGNKTTRGTAKEKGTGLGLVLVKEMVQLNKGQISLVSQPGKGTTVYLGLPLHP